MFTPTVTYSWPTLSNKLYDLCWDLGRSMSFHCSDYRCAKRNLWFSVILGYKIPSITNAASQSTAGTDNICSCRSIQNFLQQKINFVDIQKFQSVETIYEFKSRNLPWFFPVRYSIVRIPSMHESRQVLLSNKNGNHITGTLLHWKRGTGQFRDLSHHNSSHALLSWHRLLPRQS